MVDYVRKWWSPALTAGLGVLLCVAVVGCASQKEDGDDSGREVDFWTCSMHPQFKLPEPGQCPICSMDLIPVYADAEEDAGGMGPSEFKTTDEMAALMDIQVTPVERKAATAEIRLAGKVDFDETRLRHITSRVAGRLDRLFVNFTGVPVKKGDHLFEMYSEEILVTEQSLITALENLKGSSSAVGRERWQRTVDDARERLRLWGLLPEQIEKIELQAEPSDHIAIFAPIGGSVVGKDAVEGTYVKTGQRIYTIADLSQIWIKLDAYESDLMWLRYGQEVEFTSVSYPGQTFSGTVSFIDPVLDERTRTVKVRVNASNFGGKLKPGMFVKAVVRADVTGGGMVLAPELKGKWISPMHPEIIKDAPGECDICGMDLVPAEELGYVSNEADEAMEPLVIPVSAALVTGKRTVVYVRLLDTDRPRFEGREILRGPRAGDYYVVLHGLQEGELVVTKGAFKIDSEVQIQAKPSMMSPAGGAGGGGHQHH